MNWNKIWAIAKKDLSEVRQNKSVWLSIMIVPLVFILVLPLALIIVASNPEISGSLTSDPDTVNMMAKMPAFMLQATSGLSLNQSIVVMMLGYFFAPFFLILPIMFATTIASESFAGEYERKTIEALIYTPTSDAELFVGKVVAAFVPTMLITLGSFVGYILVLNIGAYPLMGRLWFPMTNWYPLIFWVSPALSLLGIAFTVLISSKVHTFMGAYQSSAALVILVLGLLVGQMTGILYLSPLVGILIGVLLFAVDFVMMTIAVKLFNRPKILASGD